MSLDPSSSTRREFSENAITTPVPDNASPLYRNTLVKSQALLQLLINHPGMVETGNANQPFMQPANSKNRVYAMWDFVGRTLGYIGAVSDPANPERSPGWDDITGRTRMAQMLIEDPQKCDLMFSMSWQGEFDRRFPFGDEVAAAAKASVDAVAGQ